MRVDLLQISNLDDDLSDGLVYKHLMEKLSGNEIVMPTGELVQVKFKLDINNHRFLFFPTNWPLYLEKLCLKWTAAQYTVHVVPEQSLI